MVREKEIKKKAHLSKPNQKKGKGTCDICKESGHLFYACMNKRMPKKIEKKKNIKLECKGIKDKIKKLQELRRKKEEMKKNN